MKNVNFSHYDSFVVGWLVKMIEESKKDHRSEKEEKSW